MTLSQFKAFCEVVDQGSFRAAARSLDTAQSALTQAIQSLETELGLALLVRSYTGISLTPQGKRLLIRARLILRETEQITLDAIEDEQAGKGCVTLGASAEPLLELMMPTLECFKCEHPRTEVNLSSGSTDFLIERIRTGRLDFALCALTPQFSDPGLEVDILYQSAVTVLARAGHPKLEARSIAQLSDCEWVDTRPEGDGRDAALSIQKIFAEQGLGEPKLAVIAESTLEKLYVVSETDYLAIEPLGLSDAGLFSDALISIPIRETIEASNVCLVWPNDRPLSAMARTLSTMLASSARIRRAATQVRS